MKHTLSPPANDVHLKNAPRMPSLLSRHSEFLRNVAVMMSGKTVAAIVAFLAMPIIARLFVPSDFGVAAMFASTTAIISSVATLSYASAIVLPKQEEDASLLMGLTYRVLLSICMIIFLVIATLEVANTNLATLEVLGDWKWLLPFSVFLMGSLHIQDGWLTRSKNFNTLSRSLVALSLGTGGSRILMGSFFGSSILGLIGGYFFGFLCRFAVQMSAVRDAVKSSLRRLEWSATKEIAGRYSDFPKFNAPAGLVFAMGQKLPVLLFGVMYAPAIAGLYAMADRLCQVPVTIVATSIRRVFLQKVAEINNRGGDLRKAFALSVTALAVVGAPAFALLWYFGEELVVLVLGDDWAVAGTYLEIVSPWLFMVWVAAPCNSIFVVLRKQRFWLALTGVITPLRLAVFGVAYMVSAKPEETLQAFAFASIIGISFTLILASLLVVRDAKASGSKKAPRGDA